MTKIVDTEPWRALPPEVADAIEPELAAVTGEILETIGREVPEYARPLEGEFGRALRTGVSEALRQFVHLIRDPESGREAGRDVYVELGRGELRQGRTLDALQSAYRVGARVAWRRLAGAARRAQLDAEVISALAESIFAYIEELSADSVEGYARERSQREGERQLRRRELVGVLLRDPPADPADVVSAADAAGWSAPRSAAVLACRADDLDRVARRLPAEALGTVLLGVGCVIVPDPGGPGQGPRIEQAASGAPAALGPAGAVSELGESWSLARSALRASEAGALPGDGLIRVDERLADLIVHEGRRLAERIWERRLASFTGLTPKARARMEETLLAYVRQQGNAAAMADALGIHPQTARYRLARLRDLLDGALDDPDARFELELALRARRGK
jgi:hypothetical protein